MVPEAPGHGFGINILVRQRLETRRLLIAQGCNVVRARDEVLAVKHSGAMLPEDPNDRNCQISKSSSHESIIMSTTTLTSH